MNQSMIQSSLDRQSLPYNEEPARPRRSDRLSSFIDENVHGGKKSEEKTQQSKVTPKLSRSKKRSDGPERELPRDFEPSSYTVIIGRGKRIAQTIGNQRLRILSKSFLAEYAQSMSCKSAKTRIVNKLVDIIKSACAENSCEAAFVRYWNGRCYEVDDSVAREKVGYQLRDLLGDKYESSSKSKVAKKYRKKLQKERKDHKGKAEGNGDFTVVSPCTSFMTAPNDAMDESLTAGASPFRGMATPNVSTSENLTATISVKYPRHEKHYSFDALQLLTEPLIGGGRGSFILEDPIQRNMV